MGSGPGGRGGGNRWFRSPDIMGGDGVPVAEAFGVDALTDMLTFTRLSTVEAGDDILETYTFSG